MLPIIFKEYDLEKFEIEFKNQPIKNNFEFLLNNQLAKNIEIFFKNLNKENISKIILVKDEALDFILKRNIRKLFTKYFYFLYNNFEIHFKNFSNQEIGEFFTTELFFTYSKKSNYIPELNEEEIIENKKKTEKYKDQFEFCEIFNKILEFHKKYEKQSYFDFPLETNNLRWVFYIYLYSEEIKKELIEILKTTSIKKEIIENLIENDLITNLTIANAIGILYNKKTNKKVRETYYLGNLKYSKLNLNKFLKDKIENLEVKDTENLKTFAIDYFKNYKEFKLYFSTSFKKRIKNPILNLVFKNKPTFQVLKLNENGKMKNEKFEFNLVEFSKNEIEIIKNELQIEDNRVIGLYFNKIGKIIKKKKYF